MPLDYFTDGEIYEAVTLSMCRQGTTRGRLQKKSWDRYKVTASKMGGFASKIEFSLGYYGARKTGLNVTGSPGEENVKKLMAHERDKANL